MIRIRRGWSLIRASRRLMRKGRVLFDGGGASSSSGDELLANRPFGHPKRQCSDAVSGFTALGPEDWRLDQSAR